MRVRTRLKERKNVATYALGIDIGGTFTDIVVLNLANGGLSTAKVLTTHDDPARGVMEGVKRSIANACKAGEIVRVVHATTLFTNALIERRGAKAGLIATEGFADTLEISRERKYDIYDIFLSVPDPVISRNLRREVSGRIAADGVELRPLDEAGLKAEITKLVEQEKIESLAVALMNSQVNSQHERRAGELIGQWYPDLPVSLSHEVSPEIGEFERTSTTAANAYVQPLATRYIRRLVAQLSELGVDAPFLMMVSNGGLTDVEEALRIPVRLLESGPAAGVLSAASFGRMIGETSLIAFDMGGTTAKIAVVEDCEPQRANRFEAAPEKRFAPGSGLPINISTIELIEIGAGGGSIARIDSLGLLKVGPKSAGSMPGPVCYGRGGRELTVTDSDMLLGCLNPDYFSGGSMKIDVSTTQSVAADLGAKIDLTSDALAMGVYDIVCENMAAAARVHVARHGKDIRDFTFYATGGAGPVHAVNVARKLGMRRVIVPLAAGVASALGLLLAPARIDRVASIGKTLDKLVPSELNQVFEAIIDDASAVVKRTSGRSEAKIERFADMRYARQGFDLTISLPDEKVTPETLEHWRASYEEEYRRQFGRVLAGQPIEVTNIRAYAVAPTFEGTVAMSPLSGEAEARPTHRLLHEALSGTSEPVRVLSRVTLGSSEVVAAPALIEEADSTVVIGGGGTIRVDQFGNLIIELEQSSLAKAA